MRPVQVPATTSPCSTDTGIWASARGAGPEITAPVVALYTDPWHGHCNCLPAGATVQPICVQIALKHAAVVAVGRATITGWPASVAETASPTVMLASLASSVGPAELELSGGESAGARGVLAVTPPLLVPQAAMVSRPAPPTPVARMLRREIGLVTPGSTSRRSRRFSQAPVNRRPEPIANLRRRSEYADNTRMTTMVSVARASRGARLSRIKGAASDEQLLRALHDEHAHALWSYVVRLTRGDRAKAQDVVQETLLRAWKNPRVLDQSGPSARGWLFTVARRIVIDDWRTSSRRPELVVDEVPERRADDVVDAVAERTVDHQLVIAALRTLSPEHREVLHECYFQGASVAQAAETLGVPAGTIKSRTHYALRALRLAIDELGGVQ